MTRVPRGVDVWAIRVSEVLDQRDFALLDAGERHRTHRYMAARHGAWFGGARAAAKRLLAGYVGVPASEVSFGRKACPRCGNLEHGPPVVAQPTTDLQISVSRAGGVALLAISARPVGVDVESRGRLSDASALARRILTPRELAFVLSASDPAARHDGFLRCWTRKEAVVKAAGIGIATALRDIETHPSDTGPVAVAGPADLPIPWWQVSDAPASFHVAGAGTTVEAVDADLESATFFVAVAQPAHDATPVTYRHWHADGD